MRWGGGGGPSRRNFLDGASAAFRHVHVSTISRYLSIRSKGLKFNIFYFLLLLLVNFNLGYMSTHTQRSLANCWTHTHTTHASMQSSRWDGEGDGEEGWTMQWYSGIQVKLRPFRLHLLLAASTSSSPVSSLHTLKYFLISTKCIIQERRSASSFPRHRVSIRY